MESDALLPAFAWAAPRLLFLFGVGFLAANIKLIVELLKYQRRRRRALLVWQPPKPRYYGVLLAVGVTQGLLLFYNVFVLRRPIEQQFGLAMMFVYYGYAAPLSTRIARGFYEDGVWSDSGFMPWRRISAVSWKEEPTLTLVLISQIRSIARRLEIPGNLYGEVRRILRDRIKAHDIHIGGTGLDLGSRDEGDAV